MVAPRKLAAVVASIAAALIAGCIFGCNSGGKDKDARAGSGVDVSRGEQTEKYLETVVETINRWGGEPKLIGRSPEIIIERIKQHADQLEAINRGDADPEAVEMVLEAVAIYRKGSRNLTTAIRDRNPKLAMEEVFNQLQQDITEWSRTLMKLNQKLEHRYGRKF